MHVLHVLLDIRLGWVHHRRRPEGLGYIFGKILVWWSVWLRRRDGRAVAGWPSLAQACEVSHRDGV